MKGPVPSDHIDGYNRLMLAADDLTRVLRDVLPRHPDDARRAQRIAGFETELRDELDGLFRRMCQPPAPANPPAEHAPRPPRHPAHRRVDEHEL